MPLTLTVILTSVALYFRTMFNNVVVDEGWGRENVPQRSDFLLKLYGAGTFKNIYLDRALTIVLFTIACLLINNVFGYLAALLYLTNPINNQISMWMNGRRYIVNIIICLSIISVPVLAPLYFITPLLQLNALFFPLVFIKTQYWWFSLLFIMPALFLIKPAFRKCKKRFSKINQPEATKITPRKFIIFIKTLSFYFWNTIIPTPKVMYYSYMQNFTLNKDGNNEAYKLSLDFWFGILTIGSVITYSLVSSSFISLCLWGWFITIAQWGNIVMYTQHLADRYCSLPAVFLLAGLAHLLSYQPVLLCTYCVICAIATLNQLRMYKDQESLLQWNMFHDPKSINPVYFKALTNFKQGDIHGAFIITREHLKHNPKDFKLNMIMAATLVKISPAQAEPFLKTTIENKYFGEENLHNTEIEKLKQEIINSNKRR